MPNGIFPEWLNINAGRAFPLAENSSRKDTTGSIQLPDSLIVAAQISMTPEYATGSFFVSRVGAFNDRVTITISFLSADTVTRTIAEVTAMVDSHTVNATYPFVGEGGDVAILGSLTLGDLAETINTIPAAIEFIPASTPFEVSALFVSTPAVKAIEIYNGTTLVQSYSDILKIRAGENILLTRIDENTIRIDAILNENFLAPESCENAIPKPPCIRTINGVGPDENGNFNLEGGECLSITAESGKIVLADLCATSCCGCNELESLVTGLNNVQAQLQSLREGAINSLNQNATMIATLVANV